MISIDIMNIIIAHARACCELGFWQIMIDITRTIDIDIIYI